MKGTTIAKKIKGKQDMRNNNSKGSNGMHNNIPLTKEHQMMLDLLSSLARSTYDACLHVFMSSLIMDSMNVNTMIDSA